MKNIVYYTHVRTNYSARKVYTSIQKEKIQSTMNRVLMMSISAVILFLLLHLLCFPPDNINLFSFPHLCISSCDCFLHRGFFKHPPPSHVTKQSRCTANLREVRVNIFTGSPGLFREPACVWNRQTVPPSQQQMVCQIMSSPIALLPLPPSPSLRDVMGGKATATHSTAFFFSSFYFTHV